MCWHLEREVFSIEGNGILHGARLGTLCVATQRERERERERERLLVYCNS